MKPDEIHSGVVSTEPAPAAGRQCAWKADWSVTRRRFVDWWNREGLLIGMWGAPDVGRAVHEDVPAPVTPASIDERYCDSAYRAAENHHRLSRSVFSADVLPMATTDLGPGSLALYCGSRPAFSEDTVWFHPCMATDERPEERPPFRLDPEGQWWRITTDILTRCAALARGRYLVGCPDLIEGIDVLSSVRGAEPMLIDMIDRPEWIELKMRELNELWFDVYERIYDIIKLDDGSSAFGAFYLWGPGRTAKVQCDCSVMISPTMFGQFVVPALTEQCEWLDHALYHLDGTQAIVHLDALLEIEPLDAIEWTPQAGIETGGHPRWYDLYRRILSAGKSVQIVNVEPREVLPLLDAVGRKGVYLMIQFKDEREAEDVLAAVGAY
jgi:hypothetical protein